MSSKKKKKNSTAPGTPKTPGTAGGANERLSFPSDPLKIQTSHSQLSSGRVLLPQALMRQLGIEIGMHVLLQQASDTKNKAVGQSEHAENKLALVAWPGNAQSGKCIMAASCAEELGTMAVILNILRTKTVKKLVICSLMELSTDKSLPAEESLRQSAMSFLRGKCVLNGNHIRIPILCHDSGDGATSLTSNVSHLEVKVYFEPKEEDSQVQKSGAMLQNPLEECGVIDTNTVIEFHPTILSSCANTDSQISSPVQFPFQTTFKSLAHEVHSILLPDTWQHVSVPQFPWHSPDISQEQEVQSKHGSRSAGGLPMGCFLVGAPGCGKTRLCKQIAAQFDLELDCVQSVEMLSSQIGEMESILLSKLRKSTEQSVGGKKLILLIKGVEHLFGQSTTTTARILSIFRTISREDSSARSRRIFIVLSCHSPSDVPRELFRSGLFEREIHMDPPNPKDRLLIIQQAMIDALGEQAKEVINDESASILTAAEASHGYVAADLVQGVVHWARQRQQAASSSLHAIMQQHKPVSIAEVVSKIVKIHWDDIGGQEETKQALQEAVFWPLQYSEAFAKLNLSAPKGLLLYGPPGCSKTLMAKALATESSMNFFSVKGPELFRKYVGDSEKEVASVFRRARSVAPSIIFFDEIDALAAVRGKSNAGTSDRVVSQLLVEMDGIHSASDVFVVAATNRPDMIDSALLRPGRLDRQVYVAPPDAAAREQIFKLHLRAVPHADIDYKELSNMSGGFSGADIAGVVREAALDSLEDPSANPCVSMAVLCSRLLRTKSSISKDMTSFYESYAQQVKNS